MDEDVMMKRVRAFQNQDFTPAIGGENSPTPEDRQTAALEYIAYQLGKIRQMMEADREQK